jgi:hypothetical protein
MNIERHKAGSRRQPFPMVRPRVSISPSRAKSFMVDCRESWRLLIEPKLGVSSLVGTYHADSEAPDKWVLWQVAHRRIERPAAIHDVEGVEILSDRWNTAAGWQRDIPTRWFYRLTDEHVQWLGELSTECTCHGPEYQVLHTFLDSEDGDLSDPTKLGKLEDAQNSRQIEDMGRYVQQPDGSYRQRRGRRYSTTKALGAGMYRIGIGDRRFTCLRVMEIDDDMPDVLDVAFVTRQGRTVLHRRYEENSCIPVQSAMRGCRTWTEAYPNSDRIVLDGKTFVVWYECIPVWAL